MLNFENTGKGTYLFGLEESYGCLIELSGDPVIATVALCEAAAYYMTQGKTLWDAMTDMYEKYGYYLDKVKALEFAGLDGAERIQNMLKSLKSAKEIGGLKVLKSRDYKQHDHGYHR